MHVWLVTVYDLDYPAEQHHCVHRTEAGAFEKVIDLLVDEASKVGVQDFLALAHKTDRGPRGFLENVALIREIYQENPNVVVESSEAVTRGSVTVRIGERESGTEVSYERLEMEA
jgi:hypothetical protein